MMISFTLIEITLKKLLCKQIKCKHSWNYTVNEFLLMWTWIECAPCAMPSISMEFAYFCWNCLPQTQIYILYSIRDWFEFLDFSVHVFSLSIGIMFHNFMLITLFDLICIDNRRGNHKHIYKIRHYVGHMHSVFGSAAKNMQRSKIVFHFTAIFYYFSVRNSHWQVAKYEFISIQWNCYKSYVD